MAGIYIHIPFCKTRCIYCDFYSTTRSDLKDEYINALCKELYMRRAYVGQEPIRTIYFGGGTPSQLHPTDFQILFNCIDRLFGLDCCEEITIEANPDDLTPAYVRQLSALPFNRLSMGIQTFNDRALKLLNRRHNARQAIRAVKNARQAGFNNISIDLMYGLPDETTESWASDLSQAIKLNVEHISAYHLTYEEGTPLYRLLETKSIKEVSEDRSFHFFTELVQQLSQAGYEQYEISNFCLPGKHSRHNSSYWKGTKYLGIGASAHSYNEISREWNTSSIADYIQGIETGNRLYEIEVLDTTTRYNDLIVTAIRTRSGLPLKEVEDRFGKKFLHHVLANAQKHLNRHELEISEGHLRLTPTGIFISDGIMSNLLWIDESSFHTNELDRV